MKVLRYTSTNRIWFNTIKTIYSHVMYTSSMWPIFTRMSAVPELRLRFGAKAIVRSCFLHSGLSSMCGRMGDGEDDYPQMLSIL